MTRWLTRGIVVALAAALIAGCGGGGGSTTPASTPPDSAAATPAPTAAAGSGFMQELVPRSSKGGSANLKAKGGAPTVGGGRGLSIAKGGGPTVSRTQGSSVSKGGGLTVSAPGSKPASTPAATPVTQPASKPAVKPATNPAPPAPPPVRVITRTRVVVRWLTRTVVVTHNVPVRHTVIVQERPSVPGGAHVPSRTPVLELNRFTVDGGNVGCRISGGTARCDVSNRIWSPPPKPAHCNVAWGQGIQVASRGLSHFVCAGDSVLDPNGAVVPNGDDVQSEGVTCQIRTYQATCFQKDYHGFTIGRTGYSTF